MINNSKKDIEKYIGKYNGYIRKIISMNLKKWLSLEYLDIYNEILYKLYELLKEKDLKKSETKFIMGASCRYWILNINRKLERQKHKTLNKAILLEKDQNIGYVLHPIFNEIKSDNNINLNEMLSLLNPKQKKIAKLFSEGYSQREIEKKLKISRYYIKHEMKEIKEKIAPYLKKRDFL